MQSDNTDKPLVSVIMPVYNCEKYVGQAIESIINQTYINWELLICDDGSTDQTNELIRAALEPRIKLIENLSNLGIVESTNRLLNLCKGEFIMLQDADDWSDHQRIQILLYEFNKSDQEVGIIGSAINRYYKDRVENLVYPPYIDKQFLRNNIEKRMPLTSASVMFRKTLLNSVGMYRMFFNNIGAGDYDFFYRASIICSIRNISEPLYCVRRNPSSFTKRFSSNPLRYCSARIAGELFLERCNQNTDSLEEKGDLFVNHIYDRYNIDSSYSFYFKSDQLVHCGYYWEALKYSFLATSKTFSWKNIKNTSYIILLILKLYMKKISK